MFDNRYFLYDFSYIMFYCINSSFNIYDKEYDLPMSRLTPDFDPTIDDEFVYILENNLENRLVNAATKVFPFIDKSNFILCEDCARKYIWRRILYPEYKLNRDIKDTSKDKFDIGKVFNYVRTYTLPKLVDKFNCLRVGCACAEGDDVIAVTTKYLLDQDDRNKVVIVSSDRDLIQLCQDRVTLVTIDGTIRDPRIDMEKLLNKKIPDDIEFTAKEFIMTKILTGDKSDNIPNIKPGIGINKAYNMVIEKDKSKLKSLLNEDYLAKKQFELNTKLISMKHIPEDIQDDILTEIKNQESKRGEIIF